MVQYSVLLHTPLGQRSGSLEIHVNGDLLNGVLHILNRSEPFTGSVDADGNCCFKGQLVTLTRTIPYRANGRLTKDSLELSLVGDTGQYRMTGVVV